MAEHSTNLSDAVAPDLMKKLSRLSGMILLWVLTKGIFTR